MKSLVALSTLIIFLNMISGSSFGLINRVLASLPRKKWIIRMKLSMYIYTILLRRDF